MLKKGRKEEDPNAGLVTQAEPKTQLLLADWLIKHNDRAGQEQTD